MFTLLISKGFKHLAGTIILCGTRRLLIKIHHGFFGFDGDLLARFFHQTFRVAFGLLDDFLSDEPDAIRLLNLRGLWDARKMYSWFADQGRWFLQLKEPRLARRMYKAAVRMSPYQPKVWTGLAKTYLQRG